MKTVLITGSGGGIGSATVKLFKTKGWKTVGLDLVENDNLSDIYIKYDLENFHNLEKISEILSSQGICGIDALVNNAAVQIVKPLSEITCEDWTKTINVNLSAPLFLIKALLPYLKKAKGSVINVSSIHSNLSKANFSLYATSKGGLTTMTKVLALELAPEIRVNAVLPAATATEMLIDGFKIKPEKLAELKEYHPLKRIAETNEIAEVIYFLASESSSFISGSAIEVNGGIGVKLHDPE